MTAKQTGGQAFPYEERNGIGEPYADHFGMTLRDYFAAKAMQAMTARFEANPRLLASTAYVVADAMIAARES